MRDTLVMYPAGDVITGVVDIGTETTKIGYAGTNMPRTFCSSAGYKNEFISPVTRSLVTDMNSYLGMVCEHVPPDAESLVISENTMERGNVKREILGYLMEKRLCSSVLFVRSGILDAFSYGKTTAVVVSVGGGSTQVCSVVDGFITCRRQMDVGGADLTMEFKDALECGGVDLCRLVRVDRSRMWYERETEFEKREVSRHVKEEICSVYQGTGEVEYEMGSGERVELGECSSRVVSRVVEAGRLVIEVIEANGAEVRGSLMGNIVVAGGGTGIKGIDVGISLQVERERPNWKSRVMMEKGRFSTFQGGSIVGSMGSVKSLHIGVGDYEEYGESILERKKCEWLLEAS